MAAALVTPREAAGRLLFFGERVEYWGYERLAALCDNDGRRLLEAYRCQREALAHLARWRGLLAEACER